MPQTENEIHSRMGKELTKSGLLYHLGPTCAVVEGSWEQVLPAIHRCHQMIANENERVVTSIVIDDRKSHPNHLVELLGSLEVERSRFETDPDVAPQF